MKKITLLSVLVISFFACKKSENESENITKTNTDIPSLMINGEIDPEGLIQAYSFNNGVNHQYQIYAYFKDHPDDQACVYVDSLVANSQNVPNFINENNNYKLSLESGGTPPVNNWLEDSMTIYIKGMGNFVAQNIKHPNLDEFTSFSLNGVVGNNNDHNKNNALTINWNQGNSSNDIYIELVFIENSSKNNGNLTITDYLKVPDNGTYTIPSSFFNSFPNNSLCLINIYRGNYANYTASNGKDIGVLTYSKATKKITLL